MISMFNITVSVAAETLDYDNMPYAEV